MVSQVANEFLIVVRDMISLSTVKSDEEKIRKSSISNIKKKTNIHNR